MQIEMRTSMQREAVAHLTAKYAVTTQRRLQHMNNEKDETIYNVPLWEKVMLTIDEAAAYTGVGSRKIRQLTDNERCPFVLWNGSKRLIKREEFVEFIKKQYSI